VFQQVQWLQSPHFEDLRRVLAVFACLHGATNDNPYTTFEFGASTSSTALPQRLILLMVHENMTPKRLELLPFGLLQPLKEAIQECRANPPGICTTRCAACMMKLSLSHSCIVAGSTDYWPREAYVLVEREDLASSLISYTERASSSTVVSATLGAVCDSDTAHTDDLPHVSSLSRMIFGKDLRLGEVQQLLQSTQHCTIRVQDTSVNELELV
jgi:hypothetical protein